MRNICLFTVLVVYCQLNFCKSGNHHKAIDPVITINLDNIISNDPIRYSELFSGVHIVPLETSDDIIIKRIDNLKLLNDTIYILDRTLKSLFIFSRNGKFIDKISKTGRGPDEYLEPVDFEINPVSGYISVLDWGAGRIITYNSKGEFKKKIDLKNRYSGFTSVENDFCLYMPVPPRPGTKNHPLLNLVDATGKIRQEYLRSSDFLRGPEIVHFVQGGNFFRSISDSKFHMTFCNVIYTISSNSATPFIELNSDKYLLGKKDLEKFNYNNFSLFELGKIKKLNDIHCYSDNPELAFFIFEIGYEPFTTFYFFDSNKTICSSHFIDDVSCVYPNLLKLFNNQLVAYIEPLNKLSLLKDNINSGKINLSSSEKDRLLKCTENDNPILIFLELKNNYISQMSDTKF